MTGHYPRLNICVDRQPFLALGVAIGLNVQRQHLRTKHRQSSDSTFTLSQASTLTAPQYLVSAPCERQRFLDGVAVVFSKDQSSVAWIRDSSMCMSPRETWRCAYKRVLLCVLSRTTSRPIPLRQRSSLAEAARCATDRDIAFPAFGILPSHDFQKTLIAEEHRCINECLGPTAQSFFDNAVFLSEHQQWKLAPPMSGDRIYDDLTDSLDSVSAGTFTKLIDSPSRPSTECHAGWINVGRDFF